MAHPVREWSTALWQIDILSELHMQISQGWLGPASLCHYSHSDKWQGWWLPGATGVGMGYALLAFQRRACLGLLYLCNRGVWEGAQKAAFPDFGTKGHTQKMWPCISFLQSLYISRKKLEVVGSLSDATIYTQDACPWYLYVYTGCPPLISLCIYRMTALDISMYIHDACPWYLYVCPGCPPWHLG